MRVIHTCFRSEACLVALAALLGCATTGSSAQTSPGAPPQTFETSMQRFAAPDHARAVHLYVVPQILESAATLTREHVMKLGCAFHSNDPAANAALFELIRRSQPAASSNGSTAPLRRVLIVDFDDDTLLEIDLNKVGAPGSAARGALSGVPFTADASLNDRLIDWARRVPTSDNCAKYIDTLR